MTTEGDSTLALLCPNLSVTLWPASMLVARALGDAAHAPTLLHQHCSTNNILLLYPVITAGYCSSFQLVNTQSCH